jgi:hypothetical protein
LYADIVPDKTQDNAANFLADNLIAQRPYQIDYAYSDLCPRGYNGKEYKGTDNHAFVKACKQQGHWSEVHPGQPAPNQRQGRMRHLYLNGHVASPIRL